MREGLHGADRVVLDINAAGGDGATLDWWHVNRQGTLVAYGLARGGEDATLFVRDLTAGRDLPDVIERTRAASVAWTPDGRGFYYTRFPGKGAVPAGDEAYYRHVYFHALGTDPAQDVKVFGDGRRKEDWPQVSLSPDGRWLLIEVQMGWSRTEVYLKDTRANGPFLAVADQADAVYDAVLRNDAIYLRTNDGAARYHVIKVDPNKPQRSAWSVVVPEAEDVLEQVAVIGNRVVAQYVQHAVSRLKVFDTQGQPVPVLDAAGRPVTEVPLPALGTVTDLGGDPEGREAFFSFESFAVPPCVHVLDLAAQKTDLWERVPAFIDSDAYEVKRVSFPSRDGTPVSMFLAHRKGLKLDGANPTLLTGYGGFNLARTPTFRPSWFFFLARGGVVALVNLRGGGEYGEAWHRAGMLDKKQNTFDDFLAAAEGLVLNKYTEARYLAVEGGSNGGLLVGAALTQRPDLFRAALCQAPLLDMLRYHKFRIGRLWIPEYGDPDEPQAFQWLRLYSPYHNVKDGVPYPAVLFTASEADTRVDPLHARKMAARLQAASTGDQPILLRLEGRAGGRGQLLEELTDCWTFLFWQLGMEP
jgi:prolyl oligopeptidase